MSYRSVNNSSTSPSRIATAERRALVLSLRRQGRGFTEIAAHVGASPSTCYRDVAQALREVGREEARELFDLEMQRLNELQAAIYPAAVEGDIKAIDTCLALMDRRARLVGLYDMAGHGPQISISITARDEQYFQ
jgi:hypothetical protein